VTFTDGISMSGWTEVRGAAKGGLGTRDPRLRLIRIPGTHHDVWLRRECAPVFAAALSLVNLHVIPLDGGPVDGWADRDARTGTGLSNHAPGVAVDFRYDVLKADHKRHMTGAQITAMHSILDHFVTDKGKRVFGWGGDWRVGVYCDEMHLEAGQAWEPGVGSFVSAVDFGNVQHRLRIQNDGTTAKVPVIAKPAPPAKIAPFPGTFGAHGGHGPHVVAIQRGLIAAGYKLTTDGLLGPQTHAALVAWQKRHPGYGKADGIVGPVTYKALAR
jgi:hypothetical protein